MKDFKQCDTLQTQVSNLFNEKGMLHAEMKKLLKKDAKSETYHKSKPIETTSNNVQSADIGGFLRFRKNKETSNENSEEGGDVIIVGEKADIVETSDRDVMKTNM